MNTPRTGFGEQNWLRTFLFTLFGTSVLVVSYFPLFYSHLGFSSSQVGYLYSIGPLISILSNLFWSMISDRLRTIKKIMIILLAGQLVTAILLAQAQDFGTVMLILSCFYFFYYPVFPLGDTMAIQTAQRYGRNFTSIRVFGSLGYAFFALTVGYVLKAAGASWSMAVCMVIVTIALFVAFMLREPAGSGQPDNLDAASPDAASADATSLESASPEPKKGGVRDIFLQREILTFFGCVFLLALGHRMNEAFLTVSMHELGAGEELIGWALLASALSEIPVFFLLSKYGDRYKELPLLAFASLMYAVRFLLMSLAGSALSMIFIQSMHSISFGIFYVTAVRYLTRMIPDRLRATGLAVFTVVWSSVSGLLSGAFGGILFQHSGRFLFYIVAMLFCCFACAGFLGKHLFGYAGPVPARRKTSLQPDAGIAARPPQPEQPEPETI